VHSINKRDVHIFDMIRSKMHRENVQQAHDSGKFFILIQRGTLNENAINNRVQ
jgi:hypothetical protein